MTARWVRRVVAAIVLLLGVTNLVLAAEDRTHMRAGFLGAGWALDAVFGARYVLLIAGIGLIIVSRSLLHGKRNAWWIALAASLVSTSGHHVKQSDALGLGLSIATIVMLIVTRRCFVARSDPALVRRGVQLLGIGLLAVLAYGTIGLYFLDRNFRTSTTLGESIEDALRLLVLLPTSTIEPVTRHGRWFVDSVRFAALAVIFVGIARIVATVVFRHDRSDHQTVLDILNRWGTTSLAPFALLDDKSWLIAQDRDAFIGYKVIGTTAVALGEPIGSPESCRQVLDEFSDLCSLNGWTPAFHQVTPGSEPTLRAAGFKTLKIGEEAIIDVQSWSIDAKEYKSLRSAIRRVERAGLELAELTMPIDDATMTQLHEVSDSWMSEGGRRERTFTVGRFDPEALRTSTVVVVRHHDSGRIVAFANVLPSYKGHDGNFDLMRRRHDAPNGVMEFLFVGLINRFRDEGYTGMNLGLAPLANITGDSLPDRALRVLYDRGDNAFHYRGLRMFKDKWQPRWEDRYLAFRTEADLPKIATAVMRAGELPEPHSVWSRGSSVARTFPVTLAIGGTIIWLMAATEIDPESYPGIMRHFGLGWRDLARLQLWRLPSSQLVQDRAGFVWANVALCLIILPIAEWTIRSRRTVAIFFLGDWISTVPVLIAVRLAAANGNADAIQIIRGRDSGPSAGAWALAAAVAVSIQNRTTRRVVVGGVFVFLVVAVVFHHRLFDVQHLLSATVTAIFVWVMARRKQPAEADHAPQNANTVDAVRT